MISFLEIFDILDMLIHHFTHSLGIFLVVLATEKSSFLLQSVSFSFLRQWTQ